MNNFTPALGHASLAFLFFAVLPRECWGMELDRLHMCLHTEMDPMFLPKLSAPVALIGEEILL